MKIKNRQRSKDFWQPEWSPRLAQQGDASRLPFSVSVTKEKTFTHQETHAMQDAVVHALWGICHITRLATLQANDSTSECIV